MCFLVVYNAKSTGNDANPDELCGLQMESIPFRFLAFPSSGPRSSPPLACSSQDFRRGSSFFFWTIFRPASFFGFPLICPSQLTSLGVLFAATASFIPFLRRQSFGAVPQDCLVVHATTDILSISSYLDWPHGHCCCRSLLDCLSLKIP